MIAPLRRATKANVRRIFAATADVARVARDLRYLLTPYGDSNAERRESRNRFALLKQSSAAWHALIVERRSRDRS